MKEEWKEYKIRDIANIKYGKMPPKSIVAEEGYSIFSGYGITGYANIFNQEDSSIVIIARGVGGTGKVKLSPKKTWITNLCLILDTNKNLVDDYFLYRYLGIMDLKRKLDTGSAQSQITINSLAPFKVTLPPLSTQQKIANILSAYDDLIENNTKRIELLEEQAQLIYEEWFVRMKFHDHENTKVDAETGLPEGWTNTTLAEIAKINANSISSSFDEDIQYIDISSVSTKSIDHTTKYPIKEAPGRAKRIVTHGDIIWSCVRPNRKSYAVIWNPEDNIIASTGFAVISPIDVPTSFLYQALGTEQFIAYLTNRATGAAYPAVKSIDFKEYDISLPPKPLINKFDAQTKSYLDVIWNLNQQNEKLKEARDILLPRLMMGIVEV